MKLAQLELIERGKHLPSEILNKNWKTIKVFLENDKARGLKIKLMSTQNKEQRAEIIALSRMHIN